MGCVVLGTEKGLNINASREYVCICVRPRMLDELSTNCG